MLTLLSTFLGNRFAAADIISRAGERELADFERVHAVNLFDASAPLNPANYAGAAANYSPTWTQSGIVGRYFRAGANFKF